MCEVTDMGGAGEAPIQEDDALEKIFSECDVPSTGRVSVTKLIGYMRDHMSTNGSPEILKDLRKSMSAAASYEGEISRRRYYDVTRRWLAKIRTRQNRHENQQDGNNNVHVGRDSDSQNLADDDLPDDLMSGRSSSTPRFKTKLQFSEDVEDGRLGVDTTGSGSDLNARTLNGFLDLSTSTVVDSTGRCESPFFGDLSSVDATFHMAIEHPVAETAQDLRLRVHRCAADNEHLKEELQRAEDSIANLERQLAATGAKLESANNRCQRLEKEHEEHKELLAVAERDREALGTRNQRLERENCLFRKEIKAAEVEIRRLNSDLDKTNEQKEERIRMLGQCRQELIEQRVLYDEARGRISQLELSNDQLGEKYEMSTSSNQHLKAVLEELETRISELQPNQNYILHGEGFVSPNSENGLDSEMRIFQDSENLIPLSLRDEIKATEAIVPEFNWVKEIENLNKTIEDQNAKTGQYVDAVRSASEQLDRATTEFLTSHKEFGEFLASENPTDNKQQLFQSTDSQEEFSIAKDLQKFKFKIRHVLTILSLMASRKIVNADTKDASTQFDLLDSGSELANNNNNNNNDNFCTSCRRKTRFLRAAKTEEQDEEPRASVGPHFSQLDIPAASKLAKTVSHSSASPSSGYFCEREIIVPIVAALDEIIQGSSGNDSSDEHAAYSPAGSKPEHYNPRQIHTLPSSRSPQRGNSNLQESYAWRCRDSTRAGDTSDDTCETGSSKSQSLSSDEPASFPSLAVDSSMSVLTSLESMEARKLEQTRNGISARNRTTAGPDVVEGLNSDLKKLTLRTKSAVENDRRIITGRESRSQSEIAISTGKVPKRKSSVYHRSFDYFSGLEVGRKTEVPRKSLSSGNLGKSKKSSSGTSEDYPESPESDIEEIIRCKTATTSRKRGSVRKTGSNQPEEATTSAEIDEYLCANEPALSAMAKPTKLDVSLGNGQAEYVISGTRNPPMRASRCPSSIEILNVAVVAEWPNEDREIDVGSRSVARAMSSEEDSSDSECARDPVEREEDAQVVVGSSSPPEPPKTTVTKTKTQPQQQQLAANGISPDFLFHKNLKSDRISLESEENRQRLFKNDRRIRRSLSESDTGPCRQSSECKTRCRCSCSHNGPSDRILGAQGGVVDAAEDPKDQENLVAFPNLPDARLIELGLAEPVDGHDLCDRIDEDELERKYTALSIGLGTDRVTLLRRLALSLRQRDQAERNLATEVEGMQRDIQALAPLCVDRESVERVERVRQQLEMVSRCALRVSCTAELLGATHQERRVSRAALLADRYLQALRARCDKLATELAETKRILIENNIVVEENPSELIDDVTPRVRYRGVPSTNRTTISRRRASIATISRPTAVNPLQEALKDTTRQHRTSLPGRMTLRRPSLGYDTQRWDNEKLDRTDSSSSSIGELREIFEQAESRRGSREENNNLIRSQSSNFSVGSCESGDSDVWASSREEPVGFQSHMKEEELSTENMSLSARTPLVFRTVRERFSRLPISWYILFVAIFFFGFYSNRFVSTRCTVPLKWWSIDEIIKRYAQVQHNVPPPI